MNEHRGHTTVVRTMAGASLALTVLLGTAGCTSSASKSSAASMPTAAGASTAAAAAPSAMPSAGASAAASPAAPAAATTAEPPANNGPVEGRTAFQSDPTAGHAIVYTGALTLQVATPADVNRQAQAAVRLAQSENGYVFAQDAEAAATADDGSDKNPVGVATADVTLKVPPAQFATVVSALEQLGKPLSVDQHAQDVTAQVVDVTSRLSVQEASVARVRVLLAKATGIGDIVLLEGQLTKREADLESMEGQLAVLKSQTTMGTITVHLQSTPTTPPPPPVKPHHPIHGFVSGLKAGGRGFVTVAVGVATVAGAILPFLALALVLAAVAWLIRRSWLGRIGTKATVSVEE